MTTTRLFVRDASDVGDARRRAAALARTAGLDDTDAGRLALVVVEAATNQVRHAGGGEMLLRPLTNAVEMVAVDRGPGIPDLTRAFRDGQSSAGGPGQGLGAMRRLATELHVHTHPGVGTVIAARVGLPDAGPLDEGAICVPHEAETVSGDAWMVERWPGGCSATVIDGLGHGPAAEVAAQAATASFAQGGSRDPRERLARAHEALSHTRGAAMMVMTWDFASGTITAAGLGNISGYLLAAGAPHRGLTTTPGIVGHGWREPHVASLPAPADAVLIAHSDGLSTRVQFGRYPDLTARPAMLIAGVLYRDLRRLQDDATVLVVRRRPAEV